MAKLNARKRKRLRSSSFVYPKQRKYPIHDKAHARAALSYAARSNTYGSAATVRRKVYKKFPSLRKTKRK
jgi:hypothetical protein